MRTEPRAVELWRVYGFPAALGLAAAVASAAFALAAFYAAGCL